MSENSAVDTSQMAIVGTQPIRVTIDLPPYKEVRFTHGEHYVATTPEHIFECLAWLLTNVDTNTLITGGGIEVE